MVVDSLGLIWGPCVPPAGHRDRDGGRWLLSQVRHLLPRLQEVVADSGFSRKFIDRVRRVCGWKVTATADDGPGFNLHPRRWVVERTFAWLVDGGGSFLPVLLPGHIVPPRRAVRCRSGTWCR